MATEEQVQDPAAFGEVSVSVTEEQEFPLDPSLLALCGNNMQHYCTMLSLMEFQNIKPLMLLKTEQGEMPLSLVTVVEDFEAGPRWDEGKEPVPFDLPQQGSPGPQVQIRYNFVRDPEGGLLQETPASRWAEQGTDLQTSEKESVASGEKVSLFSPMLMGNSNAAFQQEESVWQPHETAGQGDAGPASEQNNAHDASSSDLLQRTGGCDGDHDVGEDTIHHQEEKSPSCNGEKANEPPFPVIPERSNTGKLLCSCPSCGRMLSLNGPPTTHQLFSTYKCPGCGYHFSCYTSGSADGQQVTLTDDWEGLFHRLHLSHSPRPKADKLEKRFHCPECGTGFVHKSSIPRHLKKLHRKENPPQNSGQEKSCGLGGNPLCSPKALAKKSPLSCPNSGSRSTGKEIKPFAALCEVCGQSFSLADKFQRHLACHSEEKPFCCSHCGKAFAVKSVLARHLLLHQPEKPFRCRYCDKGYIQKSHLARHYLSNHGVFE